MSSTTYPQVFLRTAVYYVVRCTLRLGQKKIITTAVTPLGPAEILSGPVETEVQGWLRFLNAAGPLDYH